MLLACTTPTTRTYEATTDTTALKADAHGKIKASGLLTAILPAAFIPTVQIELSANVPILYVKFNFKGMFPYFRSEAYLAGGIPTATVLKLLLLWMLLSRRGLL